MTEPTCDTPPTTPVKRTHTLQRFLIIGIVVALLSGAAAIIQTVRMQKMQTELVQDWESLKEAMHHQKQITEKLTTTLADLRQQQLTETATLAQLHTFISGKQNDWQLREALYLAQLAHLKLDILRDVPAAKRLLIQADERIAGLNNAAFNTVREALLADIQTLDSLPPIDNQKVLLSLRLLWQTVPELPIIPIPVLSSTPTTTSTNTSEKGWQHTWQQSLQTLSGLIRIRDRATPISPLLSESEYRLLRESIMLYINQAEIAVLNGNNPLFQEKISQIQTQVATYFVSDVPVTRGFLQTLTSLLQLNIAPPLPSLKGSVSALQTAVAGIP